MIRPGQSRGQFEGQRLAIVGLGVSGIAMTRAALEIGAVPVVFEEKPADVPSVLSAIDELGGEAQVVTGWTGQIPSGFDTVLVSPGVPPGHPVFGFAGGPVFGEAEFAYRVARAPILAITGTNGKSTTTVMLSRILADHGAVLCGNIAGSGYPEQPLTTAALTTAESGILVAELSSAQLETIQDFRPEVATITNLQPDHLDRYKTFDLYKSAKLRLSINLREEQDFVINLDETSIEPNYAGLAHQVTFSPSGKAIGNGVTYRTPEEVRFGVHVVPISDLPFVGEMNIANAMCAWEMAYAFMTMRDQTIGQAELDSLLEFRPLAHRMEPLGSRNGVQVINNSMCTNPRAVIESAKSLGGKLHLLMGGNPKNLDFSALAQYLRENPHKVYLYGNDAMDLREIIGLNLDVYPSIELAFSRATENAQGGETILLAPGCASTAPFANFKERGDVFKQIAKEWLNHEA